MIFPPVYWPPDAAPTSCLKQVKHSRASEAENNQQKRPTKRCKWEYNNICKSVQFYRHCLDLSFCRALITKFYKMLPYCGTETMGDMNHKFLLRYRKEIIFVICTILQICTIFFSRKLNYRDYQIWRKRRCTVSKKFELTVFDLHINCPIAGDFILSSETVNKWTLFIISTFFLFFSFHLQWKVSHCFSPLLDMFMFPWNNYWSYYEKHVPSAASTCHICVYNLQVWHS